MIVVACACRVALALPPDGPFAEDLPEPRPPATGSAWVMVKDLDGVVVDRAASQESRGSPAFGAPWSRGTAIIDAPLDRVVAHILDFGNLTRFVPTIIVARVISRSDGNSIVYYRLHLPWPLDDRQWTVAYKWRWSTSHEHFDLAWSDVNEQQPLDGKRAITVQTVRGTWQLDRQSPTTTRGVIVQLITLGGWIPKSVVEETVWKQPLQTFRGIRQALQPIPLK